LSWPIVTGFGAAVSVGVESADWGPVARVVAARDRSAEVAVGRRGADAAHLSAGDVRPVTGRIGGHRFERFVWPPGPAPSGPEAIRTDGGCWIKFRPTCSRFQIRA
jgi:hypothetical protein